MAPDANVVYVGAASCADQDLRDALALIVNNHLASIVSDSWGEPADTVPSLIRVYEQIFQAGAAEGIGFFFSSGDSGYESPAEDPGSDMTAGRLPDLEPVRHLGRRHQPGHRPVRQLRVRDLVGHPARPAGGQRQVLEYTAARYVYPEYYDGSGGGGVSYEFTQPSYQEGVVPDSLATSTAERLHQPHPDAGDTGRVGAGRPQHRHAGRARPRCSRTAPPSRSRSAGSAAPASPARSSPASRRTRSRPPATRWGSPTRRSTSGTARRAFHDVTDHPLGPGSPGRGPQQLHRPGHQDRPADHVPAHARHRRRGPRRAAGREGLRRLHRRRLARPVHPVLLGQRTARAGLDRLDGQGLDRLGARLRRVGQVDRDGLVRRVDTQEGRLGRAAGRRARSSARPRSAAWRWRSRRAPA